MKKTQDTYSKKVVELIKDPKHFGRMNKTITKLLAFVCAICPLCIFTRAYPNLKISRAILKIESICPFCAAYIKIKNQGLGKRD